VQPEPSQSTAVRVAYVTTVILLAGTLLFGVLMRIPDVISGTFDHPSFDARAPLNFKAIPAGLQVEGGNASFSIEHPTTRQQRLAAMSDVIPDLLFVAVLVVLLRIARSVRDGNPFSSANVRRLRVIGLLLFAGSLLVESLQQLIRSELARQYLLPDGVPIKAPGLRLDAGLRLTATPLVCGIGAFVLAQVFLYGIRLREDVDRTI
jgi:uncharacterized membrane protein YgdD (TMEM256/DUF423 family)